MANSKMLPHAISDSQAVNAYMDALDHPLKAEVQAVRDIIKNVHPDITEQVKWTAPSFSYKGYLATFNLRAIEHVHLIFHNGAASQRRNSRYLLELGHQSRQ